MNTEVEAELCPRCLKPNPVGSHLCQQCGAPLTAHASTDPLLSLWAEGHALRSAAARPHKLTVVIGIWLLGLAAFGLGMGTIYTVVTSPSVDTVLSSGAGLGLLGLWAAILVKTTRSYARLRRADRKGPGSV